MREMSLSVLVMLSSTSKSEDLICYNEASESERSNLSSPLVMENCIYVYSLASFTEKGVKSTRHSLT